MQRNLPNLSGPPPTGVFLDFVPAPPGVPIKIAKPLSEVRWSNLSKFSSLKLRSAFGLQEWLMNFNWIFFALSFFDALPCELETHIRQGNTSSCKLLKFLFVIKSLLLALHCAGLGSGLPPKSDKQQQQQTSFFMDQTANKQLVQCFSGRVKMFTTQSRKMKHERLNSLSQPMVYSRFLFYSWVKLFNLIQYIILYNILKNCFLIIELNVIYSFV